MPRGGRSSGRSRSSSPSRPAPRAAAPARPQPPMVAQAPPRAAAAPAAQGPGLMGQMMATAGGVAIGSAAGHALTGVFSGGDKDVAQAQQQEQSPMDGQQRQQAQYGQQQQSPCSAEFQSFIECTQNQSDISMCEGLNQMLRECKMQYESAPRF